MSYKLCFFTIAYLLTVNLASFATSISICINELDGADNLSCLNSTHCCQNLEWVLQHPISDNTNFILSEGTHELFGSFPVIKDLQSIAFEGNDSIIDCANSTGLIFVNISNLSFHDVTITSCGAMRNSTSKKFNNCNINCTEREVFKVAVYIYNCSSVSMTRVTIDSSPGGTGLVLYDVSGENVFMDCEFTNNSVNFYEEDKQIGGGGGGVYIEQTYCKPGAYCIKSEYQIHGSKYEFTNCIFGNNVARNRVQGGGFIYPNEGYHQSFGRGGGMSLFAKGSNALIELSVVNCTFEDNVGLWGGGLFVELGDTTFGNTIIVVNTSFVSNKSPIESGGGGGGLRLAEYIAGSIPRSNSFQIDSCTFKNNSAINGGGLSLSWAKHFTEPHDRSTFLLSNLCFENNTGRLGSALYIEQLWQRTRHHGLEADIQVVDSDFIGNSDKFYNYVYKHKMGTEDYNIGVEQGIGSLYVSSSSVNFIGIINFENNVGSALAVSDGNVNLENSTTNFIGNTGNNGGAVTLTGMSTLDIAKGTEVLFENNVALIRGGAIYAEIVSRQTRRSDPNCFIRYVDPFVEPKDWGVSMTFIGNKDHGGQPNSIHATSILPCADFAKTTPVSKTFCWDGWEYYEDYGQDNASCENQISSDIGFITYSDPGANRSATPGWKYTLPILLKDDLNNIVKFTDTFVNIEVSDNKSNITFCKDDVTLYIHSGEDQNLDVSITIATDRVWLINTSVYVNMCPLGFIFDPVGQNCTCRDKTTLDIICYEQSKKVEIAKYVWVGLYQGSDYNKISCPYHYCAEREVFYVVYNGTSDELCRNNRAGTICGECTKDHGPAVNSFDYECVKCTGEDLVKHVAVYILAMYVPIVVIFSGIIVFDIRLTTGPGNSFVLFCQLITTTLSLDANGGIPVENAATHAEILMMIYRIPYDIFNLNIIGNYIPSFCFSTNMDTLSVLCLEYGIAFFPLVMIVLIVAIFKCKDRCRCVTLNENSPGKLKMFVIKRLTVIHNALLPAFAAFILLSYTKLSTISSHLLTAVKMNDGVWRMYLAGQHTHNSIEYKVYLSVGIVVFSTFVLITPIILLDYPLRLAKRAISKCPSGSRIYPTAKIQALLDTFQGCFKDNMRFFAGLYFACRLVLNLAYVFSGTWFMRFAIQQITLTILIVLLALFKPYREDLNYVNYVDILILSNLAVLNCLSSYLYVVYKNNPTDESPELSFVFYLQYFLVYTPLIYMIGYFVWHAKKERNHQEPLSSQSSNWSIIFNDRESSASPEIRIREQDPLIDQSDSHHCRVREAESNFPSRSYEALELRDSSRENSKSTRRKSHEARVRPMPLNNKEVQLRNGSGGNARISRVRSHEVDIDSTII